MHSQRQVQFKSSRFLPLITFSQFQQENSSFSMREQATNLLSVTILGLSKNRVNRTNINELTKLNISEQQFQDIIQSQSIWINASILPSQNQNQNQNSGSKDEKIIFIGANLNQNKNDIKKIKLLGQISSLIIIDQINSLNNQELQFLIKNMSLIENIPSIWIKKQGQCQNQKDSLKQQKLQWLLKIINNNILSKNFLKIDEENNFSHKELVAKISQNIFNCNINGVKSLSNRVLINKLKYLTIIQPQQSLSEYLKIKQQKHLESLKIPFFYQQLNSKQISLSQSKFKYIQIKQQLKYQSAIYNSFSKKVIQTLFDQLVSQTQMIKNNNTNQITQLQTKLKQSILKTKQIQERYQSTKRYVEIVRNQYQDQLKQNKIKYENEIEQLKKRLEEALKSSNSILQDMYKEQLKQHQLKNKQLSDRIQELNKEIATIGQSYNIAKIQIQQYQTITNKNKQIQSTKSQSQIHTQTSIQIKSSTSITIDTQLEQPTTRNQLQLQTQNLKLSQQLKSKQTIIDTLRTKLHQLTKQQSLMAQKQQLTQLELISLKQKYNEAKQSQAKALDLLQTNNHDVSTSFMIHEDSQINIKLEQITQSTKTYQIKIKNLQLQLKKSKDLNNSLQLQVSLLKQQIASDQQTYETSIQSLKQSLQNKQSQYSKLLSLNDAKFQDIKSKYQSKISSLEEKLDELRQSNQVLLIQNKDSSQADVLMIKSYYEQKSLLSEKKSSDEKAKLQNKYKTKITQLQEQHKEQIQSILERKQQQTQNLIYQSQEMSNIIRMLQSDQIIKTNQINRLNEKIKYMTSSNQSQLLQIKSQNQLNITGYKEHISLLQKKYEQYKQSSRINETKILSSQKDLIKKTKQIQQLKIQLSQLNQQLKQKISLLQKLEQQNKKINDTIINQTCQNKIQIQKKNILSEQYVQYSEKKISQLQATLSSVKFNNDKQKQEIVMKMTSTYNSEIQVLKKQNTLLNSNYQELISSSKNKQVQLLKRIGEIQGLLASSREKTIALQLQKVNTQEQLSKNKESSLTKINQYKDQLSQIQTTFKTKIQQLQSKIKDLQNQIVILNHQLQKNTVLYKDKISFIQEQKRSQKIQHEEKIRRMNGTIDFLKTKQKNENIQESINNIENQYMQQIKTLSQNKLKQQLKYQQTIKLLNMQLKSQKQKNIQLQYKYKQNSASVLGVSNRHDKSYEAQIQKIKEQKQLIITTNQQLYFTEKENLRSKIKNLEEKIYQLERNKSYGLFEQEKNQAKWNLQKQHLKENVKELEQTIAGLKKGKEKLERDNQAMKVQKKKYKNLNMSMSMNMNSNLKSSMFSSFNKWDESQKHKNINVKDYSIFGSESRTPDVLSNNQDSIISQRETQRSQDDNLVVKSEVEQQIK